MKNKKIILILAACILLVGITFSLGSALRKNIIEINRSDKEDNVFVPGEFGGKTALYSDFSEEYVKDGNWAVSNKLNPYTDMNQNMYFASNNGIEVYSTSGENGALYFSHNSADSYDTSKVPDPYAIFDNRIFTTYNGNVNYLDCRVSDKKAFTMDIDVELSENVKSHTLTIRPLWRDANNSIIYRSNINGTGFLPLRIKDGKVLDAFGSPTVSVPENFHVTVVVFERYGIILANYYIDGVCVLDTCQNDNLVIPSSAVKFSGLRFGISGDTSYNEAFEVKVDNIIINVFEKDYSGDIDKLVNANCILENLNYNSDTVLGQSNNKIFEDNFNNKGVNANEE